MLATQSRKPPSFACEECRRRKARCDRQKPRCGSCEENGSTCITVYQRPPRGPRKGQIQTMKSRIAELEREISRKDADTSVRSVSSSPIDVEVTVPAVPDLPSTPGSSVAGLGLDYPFYADIDMGSDNFMARMAMADPSQPHFNWPAVAANLNVDGAIVPVSGRLEHGACGRPSTGISNEDHPDFTDVSTASSCSNTEISDLMLADLYHLYFDRVHDICPMVHERRYFSWAGQEHISHAQECLRSAVRTMAAAMSAQHRSIFRMLHSQTSFLLEESMQKISKHRYNTQIEYIQAWLLLAHFESLTMNESQAMLTSGRAFRLVQMARLYEMDSPDKKVFSAVESPNAAQEDSFAVSEERRRTFWVAYNLDYFLSWRKEQPLTLYEDMVNIRLPAPEFNFQNSQPIRTDMLSEAVTKGVPATLSPFAECVVLVTLHGRCMAHRRTLCKETGKEAHGVLARHEWLASAVERHVAALAQVNPTAATAERDPMLFFTRMLARSAIVCLGNTLQIPWHAAQQQHQPSIRGIAMAYEQRASRAALEMASLIKALPSLSRFKAHPFLPNLLSSALAYLRTQNIGNDSQPDADILLRLLRDLRDVNSLALEIFSHDF